MSDIISYFSIFIIITLVIIVYISLKILSDYVSCIGIYHSIGKDEDFSNKFLKILRYNFNLSLPFLFGFYFFVEQLISTSNVEQIFIISASITLIILFNARLLSNPTKYTKPIECGFIDEPLNEILKIKERMLSFFFAFVAISVITIVIKIIHIQLFYTGGHNIDINFTMGFFILVVAYCGFLFALTLVGEIILYRFEPIAQIDEFDEITILS
ncbi:MAG: hypothetical protein KAT05_16375 [Spirochaetes bacterium]|nr:hypothetical protein [Spirochaetota bacterium]